MNIIILGAGFGGITVATRLADAVKGAHKITLIDRKDSFFMGLAKLWVLVGERPPEEGRKPLNTLVARGVEVIQDEIRRIDVPSKTVVIKSKILTCDYLVIAMGAETSIEAVLGLPSAANLYDVANIPGLRDQLKIVKEGEVAIVVCGTPYKCPPAPYECAMLVDYALRKRKVRQSVKISVYIPEERPMTVAGPSAGEQVMKMLEEKGIKVEPQHKVVKVDPSKKKLFFENGHEHEYSVLLAIPPHIAPYAVKNAGLTDASGWITVAPDTLSIINPQSAILNPQSTVFAIGDVTSMKLPGGGMLPKAGIMAECQGEVVADHILASLEGKTSTKTFDGKGYCYFEAGDHQARKVVGDFFADPATRTTIEPPSEENFRLKQQFEQERLTRWFSGESK